jgi:hypothetical protein
MRLWPWRRSPRLLALLAFRNEMRFLPDWFRNVGPQVDGIVALDDGSTDGSAEFVSRQRGLLEMIRNPAVEPHLWDDAMNHRRLVEASWQYHPSWLIAVDADERLEMNFRKKAEKEMDRAAREGHRAYRVRVRELWDHPLKYRSDGIWGAKSAARFFEARRDHQFHMQRLHCHWAPLNSMRDGDFPQADLTLYHLRMLRAEDRLARQERYETLDPDRALQAIGYDYMTDPTGLRLETIAEHRRYHPLPEA